jgi:hypothetical protein
MREAVACAYVSRLSRPGKTLVHVVYDVPARDDPND